MYFSPAFVAAAAAFLVPVTRAADIDRPQFSVSVPATFIELPMLN